MVSVGRHWHAQTFGIHKPVGPVARRAFTGKHSIESPTSRDSTGLRPSHEPITAARPSPPIKQMNGRQLHRRSRRRRHLQANWRRGASGTGLNVAAGGCRRANGEPRRGARAGAAGCCCRWRAVLVAGLRRAAAATPQEHRSSCGDQPGEKAADSAARSHARAFAADARRWRCCRELIHCGTAGGQRR
jgi:hypothetical protein